MHLSELPLSPKTREAVEKANIPPMHLLLSDCKLPPETLKKARDALCSVISARAVNLTTPPPPIEISSKYLSTALDGGLPATRIIQLAGPSLSGKTHLALSFAASTLKEGKSVIWLETSSAASDVHARLKDLSKEQDLSRLIILPIASLDHAISVLQAIKQDHTNLSILGFAESDVEQVLSNPRLIVLDSLASLIAPVLGLRKGAWSGHVALNQLAVLLRWLAIHTNASVVVINRVVRGEVGSKPALGNLWACFADISMVCEVVANAEDDTDIKILLTSKRGPDAKLVVRLRDDGMDDVADGEQLT